MTIYRYYQVAWLLLLPCAFGLGALANVIPKGLALLAFALSVACLSTQTLNKAWSPKVRRTVVWVFAVVCWLHGISQFWQTDDFFPAIGQFLAGLIPVLISRRQQIFGHWMALLVAAMLALVGVIGGGAAFEYILLLGFLGFLVFILNAANLLVLAGPVGALQQKLPRGHFRQMMPSLSAGLIFGILLFFVFPRTPRFLNPFNVRARGGSVSAYTGTVSLKSTGPISESSSLAMLVESEFPEWLVRYGNGLYFRGNTLESFDGQDWSSPVGEIFPFSLNSDLRHTTSLKLPARKFRIFREPHSTRFVLYPQVLLMLNAPLTLLGGITWDVASNLRRGHEEEIRYSYEVVVAEAAAPAQLASMTLAEIRKIIAREERATGPRLVGRRALAQLLEIPPSVGDQEYFAKWIREVNIHKDKSTLQDVFYSLDNHFQNHFKQTLSRKVSDVDTFRSFLALDREGHCEYFATAAALHLRALGIPARIVLGYRGGTFNNISKVLEVRERNAHAWVEAYLPGTGWMTFDPIPLEPIGSGGGLGTRVSLYVNAVKFWFNRYVVNYNSQAQRDLFRSIASGSPTKGMSFRLAFSWDTFKVVLMVGFIVLFILRRRRKQRRKRARLPDYYEAFLRRMEKSGWMKERAETYAAFHRRLAAGEGNPALFETLTDIVERDIYGPRPATSGEISALKTRLQRFKARVARHPRGGEQSAP